MHFVLYGNAMDIELVCGNTSVFIQIGLGYLFMTIRAECSCEADLTKRFTLDPGRAASWFLLTAALGQFLSIYRNLDVAPAASCDLRA